MLFSHALASSAEEQHVVPTTLDSSKILRRLMTLRTTLREEGDSEATDKERLQPEKGGSQELAENITQPTFRSCCLHHEKTSGPTGMKEAPKHPAAYFQGSFMTHPGNRNRMQG